MTFGWVLGCIAEARISFMASSHGSWAQRHGPHRVPAQVCIRLSREETKQLQASASQPRETSFLLVTRLFGSDQEGNPTEGSQEPKILLNDLPQSTA